MRRTAAALLAVAGSLVAVAPSSAASPVPCGARAVAPVFAPWSDPARYFRASNGGFESGTTDWTLAGGATVVAGQNEPWRVGGSTDSHALSLAGLSSVATTRELCVAPGEDVIRLFARGSGVTGAILHVDVTARDSAGINVGTSAFDIVGTTGWAPSIALHVPALWGASGQEFISVRLSERGVAASWLVDDLYVDPFKNT